MRRNFIFLLLSLLLFFILVACSTSGKKSTDHALSSSHLRLENLGNGICREVSSGLMWQIEESEEFSTWVEADTYVKTISLAGFHDWRLPTYDEWYKLTELLQMQKSVDCPIKIKGSCWISDNKKNGKAGHWEDYPLCGGPELHWIKSKKGTVRAVRP